MKKKIVIFTIILIIMQIVLLPLVGDRNYVMALSSNITDDMILIPSNPNFTFKVGINGTQGEKSPIERDYYINKYMVTCAQYKEFIDNTNHKAPSYWNGRNYPEGKANHPVLYVSYNDAVDYTNWLSSKNEGWKFRLPTEAEWENAAYAPSVSGHENYIYPWGETSGISYNNGILTNKYNLNCNTALAYQLLDNNGPYGPNYEITYVEDKLNGQKTTLGELLSISSNGGVQIWANHNTGEGIIFTDLFKEINSKGGTTVSVDSGYRNYYGLYGMAGNAWSWTSSKITATNGLEAGQQVRAIRGGSWYATVGSCSAKTRGEGRADGAMVNTVGFRVAADKATNDTTNNENASSTNNTSTPSNNESSSSTNNTLTPNNNENASSTNKETIDTYSIIFGIFILIVVIISVSYCIYLIKQNKVKN